MSLPKPQRQPARKPWPTAVLLALLLASPWAGPSPAADSPAGAAGAWGVEPSSWHLDLRRYAGGAHGTLACAACHEKESRALAPGSLRRHPDPQDAAYLSGPGRAAYDYAQCAPCHRLAAERVRTGAHAKALAEQAGKPLPPGRAPAPRCGHCHDAHYQPAHQDRLAVGRRAAEVCGSCHARQLTTYLEGYHGRAAFALGHAKAAFCADCHGGHTASSLKEPAAALAACLRCHPQATPSFAQFVIHPAPPERPAEQPDKALRVAVIRAVGVLMAVLVGLLVAFFWGHSLVWLLRDLHHKLRREGR